jgi:histidine triad (HIT) family protein
MMSPPPTQVPVYDGENPFAKILRGEWPSFKVYEDDKTVAIMDIMPRADGHTLVIPKAPVRNMLDCPPDVLAACLVTVQKIGRAQMIAYGAEGITVQQFNESAGGQVVFHLHYHVLPRKTGDKLRPHTGERAANDTLKEHAAMLIAALAKV